MKALSKQQKIRHGTALAFIWRPMMDSTQKTRLSGQGKDGFAVNPAQAGRSLLSSTGGAAGPNGICHCGRQIRVEMNYPL
jgi:hypothetical protein